METNIQSTCQAVNNVRGEEPGTSWRKKIRNTFISSAQTTSAVPHPHPYTLCFTVRKQWLHFSGMLHCVTLFLHVGKPSPRC